VTPLLLRSMLLVFGASVVGSFGAVFLKLGAMRLNKSILSFVNARLILGVALYLGSSYIYAMGVKGGPLSVLYPMVSLGYIFTLLWSKLFFHEPLNRYKFAGLGLILVGVFLVGMGSGSS
jgi:drug/metabolite transporter (DMT)-like permease